MSNVHNLTINEQNTNLFYLHGVRFTVQWLLQHKAIWLDGQGPKETVTKWLQDMLEPPAPYAAGSTLSRMSSTLTF